jgi:hypothetical protein
LKLSGFDLSLTGFGELELKDLLAERTAPTLPPSRAAARTRARLPEIKDRGRPTRSSGGRSIG